ncbi:MAG TPA: FHA domain-containing protein [Kofleriaceae bacterium]
MNDDDFDTLAADPTDLAAAIAPSQAYLVVVRGTNVGASHAVVGPEMVIGRGADANLRVNDEGVSRLHCKIHEEHGAYVLEDLGSRNGTFCNGEPVLPTMRTLYEGDRVQIGTTFVLRFTFVESRITTSMPIVQESVRDPGTGAFSRRYFMEQLDKDVTEALQTNRQLSLVLVHIDRFADLPEPQLQITARAVFEQISENIGDNTLLARIGVADFALVLRNTSPGNTFMLAERLRKHVMSLPSDPPVHISVGVAAISELRIETSSDFLAAAGSALQQVRSHGGNRTVLCTPELVREPKNRATV